MSDSSSPQPKSSNFCKLFGELAISYNGHLVDCVPKEHSRNVDTILTVDGKVYTKEECNAIWDLILTPAVFLFYDNKTNVTFEVDTCKQCIRDLKPHGRILDATDKKIYEIKDSQWCPVYDFNVEKSEECNTHVGAVCGGALKAEALSGLNRDCPAGVNDELYYFPGDTGVTTWRVGGFVEKVTDSCPQVVAGNSWVAPQTADYDFHAVLTYQTANQSVVGLIEDSGSAFDNFLLVLIRDGKKVVIGRVPVNYDTSLQFVVAVVGPPAVPSYQQLHYYLGSSGQAVFNQTLRLLKGDSLSLYLVSHLDGIVTQQYGVPPTPSNPITLSIPQIYLLDPLGTTISVHAIDCVDDCNIPILSTIKYGAPVLNQ